MAAQTAGKSNSALGAFYRRLRYRLGTPKAITATAHKLARIFIDSGHLVAAIKILVWTTMSSVTMNEW